MASMLRQLAIILCDFCEKRTIAASL